MSDIERCEKCRMPYYPERGHKCERYIGAPQFMYEDQLPEPMSDADYAAWFKTSMVVDGVRVGKVLKMSKLFDSKCLDLARHFYPDYPEPILALLAEEIQTVCEDFTGGLKHDLQQILDERRAAQETKVR